MGFKGFQTYTIFKTLYETKVYYLENALLNFCLIISKIKNLMNIFEKIKFSRIYFIQIFFITLNSH